MTEPQQNQNTEQAQTPPPFTIQRIYVKDVSFETPNSPSIFRSEWRPEVDIRLFTDASRLEGDLYEVFVRVTVTAEINSKTAFLVEVKQAGIFGISGLPEDRLKYMLGSFCPNILFPYARETVSDLISRGGFPQFLLAPVNFDAIYAKHLEDAKEQDFP